MGWLLLISWDAALGAEVYKWVDEQGKVHYGDHRSAQAAEPLKLRNSASTPDPGHEVRQLEQQKLLESYAVKRKEKKSKAAEAKKEREQQRQNCDKAKAQIHT
jgi:hypothetical protein